MTTAPLTPSTSRSTVPILQSSLEVKNQSFCPGSNPHSSLSSALSWRTEQFPSPLCLSCLHRARKVSTVSGSIWKWLQRFGIMGNDWSRDFKKGKKKFKKKSANTPRSSASALSAPKEEKEPVQITAARWNHSCTITHVPALLIHSLCRELQRHGEFSSSACQESVTQQKGYQVHISLTQSDNTSNGGFF